MVILQPSTSVISKIKLLMGVLADLVSPDLRSMNLERESAAFCLLVESPRLMEASIRRIPTPSLAVSREVLEVGWEND